MDLLPPEMNQLSNDVTSAIGRAKQDVMGALAILIHTDIDFYRLIESFRQDDLRAQVAEDEITEKSARLKEEARLLQAASPQAATAQAKLEYEINIKPLSYYQSLTPAQLQAHFMNNIVQHQNLMTTFQAQLAKNIAQRMGTSLTLPSGLLVNVPQTLTRPGASAAHILHHNPQLSGQVLANNEAREGFIKTLSIMQPGVFSVINALGDFLRENNLDDKMSSKDRIALAKAIDKVVTETGISVVRLKLYENFDETTKILVVDPKLTDTLASSVPLSKAPSPLDPSKGPAFRQGAKNKDQEQEQNENKPKFK